MAGLARGAHQLVAGVRNKGRSGVADKRNRLIAEFGDDARPVRLARVVVIALHRNLGADMSEEFRRHSGIFDQNAVCPAKRVRGAATQVSKVADRGRDDV